MADAISVEEFVARLQQALVSRAYQLQNTYTGFQRSPGSGPSPFTLTAQFERFIRSDSLWQPALDADSLTGAIDVFLSQIIQQIAAEDPLPQFGGPVTSPDQPEGPGPLISSDFMAVGLVRSALAPVDETQALAHSEAFKASSWLSDFERSLNTGDALGTFDAPPTEADLQLQEQTQLIDEAVANESISQEEGDFLKNQLAVLGDPDFFANPTGGPTPIGVPPGFSAEVFPQDMDPDTRQRELIRLATTGTVKAPARIVEPRYFEGDQVNNFAYLAPEVIAGIQVQLAEAGLYGTDSFRPGFWDPESATAMTTVMAWANYTGTTWQQSLSNLHEFAAPLKDEALRAEQASIFTPLTFEAPDPDSLANEVFSTFQGALGRDPSAEELATYMNLLDDLARQSFDASEQARYNAARVVAEAQAGLDESMVDRVDIARYLAEHPGSTTADAVAALQPTGESPALITPETPTPVQAVDPLASFMTAFRNRYTPEIELQQQRTLTHQASTDINSGFLGFLSMIRNNPFAP